jgi:hypothetical protein
MEDDEMYLNDDDLAKDNQLTIVDEALKQVLDSVIETAKKAKDCIDFNETTDASSNIAILAKYTDALLSLDSKEMDELSDEEQSERVDKILRSTTELTLSNIDDVIPDQEEDLDDDGDNSSSMTNDGNAADDSGIDF